MAAVVVIKAWNCGGGGEMTFFLMLRLVLDSLFVFKKVKAKTRKKKYSPDNDGFSYQTPHVNKSYHRVL